MVLPEADRGGEERRDGAERSEPTRWDAGPLIEKVLLIPGELLRKRIPPTSCTVRTNLLYTEPELEESIAV